MSGGHAKVAKITKNSKGTEVKMLKNAPPVNNLAIIKLYLFKGIT